MALHDELRRHGGLLFRWRSLLPLLLVLPALAALGESGWLEVRFGETADEVWMGACLAVSLAGQLWRCLTVGFIPAGTSGRNTREQRAEALNITGVYSLTRNPLYFGNFLVLVGFALAIGVWWFALLVPLAFALYYERIILAEEAFLQHKFGAAFEAWASRTPAFLPRLTGWTRPALPFSLRTVARREYNGFALILVTFGILDLGSDVLSEGLSPLAWVHEDAAWAAALVAGLAVLLVFRFLKRHTGMLRVDDR